MKRSTFLKRLGIGAGVVAIAPSVIAQAAMEKPVAAEAIVGEFVDITKHFGLPLMTKAQRLAISSPDAGLMVMDEENRVFVFTGKMWCLLKNYLDS